MSGFIFVDDEDDDEVRSDMRQKMRHSYRRGGGTMSEYRRGYKHGWEDSMMGDDDDMEKERRKRHY